ncbi:metallophosphoesterase [Goodfellowiella coeruleoviolacea]|uniref:3',5'-cyclic AMP phosphodiesterase CpdA n=1 Tax=Goodfellowiella coeruleoviolacea TaxID=334858 RepID=A0AAE3GLC6_9PSEU|nr:metallophosphoesterase [Goodfellowiella coeruleoviolacea]MCP2169743.1 3',5'-cyclic AMP phosphodiesterase CpdA [Goodfellowiella coeruleoviolacea]
MFVLAHISDVHVDGGDRSVERARRVLRFIGDLAAPVDAVLLTGDIADHGRPDEYARVNEILAGTALPVLTCPGNHDVRGAYREVLLGEPTGDDPAGDEPINQVVRVGAAVFALCDSSIPGRDDGYLADETLTWLEEVLTEHRDGAPVFVCFHHPPVPLHNPVGDTMRQFGEQRLAAVLDRHPQVVAVLCGHAHQAAATTFAGRPLLVAPGVVATARLLPWERGDIVDLDSPPMIALHVLDDDGRLTTHYRVVR